MTIPRLDARSAGVDEVRQDGYDFFYTYGLDKLQVMTIGEGSNWWGQSIKKCVNMAYVHTDRLGSVVNLSDQYGRVTARADYTDWGEVRRYTDITVDGGFRRLLPEITYATHEYDDVLNQFYAKARMYDAVNKRFAAVDPILDPVSAKSGLCVLPNPMMLVQQVYAFDAPYTYIDPLGLMNYFTQTDDLLSGVWKGVKDNTIGLVESIPQAVPMVKELVKGVIGGDIDIAELAKAVLKGAVGDYWHVIRYADTLNPLKKKTDSEVYNYGRCSGSVASQILFLLLQELPLLIKQWIY
ncbi:MAG: RHS repeat domain-containing protein [Oscillibacter sp.]